MINKQVSFENAYNVVLRVHSTFVSVILWVRLHRVGGRTCRLELYFGTFEWDIDMSERVAGTQI